MIFSKDAIEQRTLIQTENRVCLPANSFAHLFSIFFFLVIKKPCFHPDRTVKRREHFQLAPRNKQIPTVQSYGMIWLTASIMVCTLCRCQSVDIQDSSHFLGWMNLGWFNFYFLKTILIRKIYAFALIHTLLPLKLKHSLRWKKCFTKSWRWTLPCVCL